MSGHGTAGFRVLGDLADALGACGVAVLSAPPGTGKSTLVPLALADAPWLGDGRVLVLEPRRLAARAVARRLAQLSGEPWAAGWATACGATPWSRRPRSSRW